MERKASVEPQSPVRERSPFQRFSVKQRLRNHRTVMKSCRKCHWLPFLIACLKLKEISRYELSIWVLTDTLYFRVEHRLLPLQGSFFLLSDLGPVPASGQLRCTSAFSIADSLTNPAEKLAYFFSLLECFLLGYSTTLTQRSGEDQSQNKHGGST